MNEDLWFCLCPLSKGTTAERVLIIMLSGQTDEVREG